MAGSAIIGGGAIIGGLLSSNSSKSAANTQAQASQYATDAQIAFSEKALKAQMAAQEKAMHAELEAASMAAGATRDAARMAADAQLQSAEIQQEIAERAIAEQQRQYNLFRKDLRPYRKAGKEALPIYEQMLEEGPGELTKDPGYQFRLDEGNKNILGAASATGGLASGRTLKALQEYGQNYATNEYDKFYGRYLNTLSGYGNLISVGQNAAAQTGNAGMQQAQMTTQTLGNLGNNMAGIYGNLANIYQREGTQLANIESSKGANLANMYSNMGNAMASTYLGQGNALANNYLQQGNAMAAGQINSSNAWTGAINSAMSGIGSYWGMNGAPNFGSLFSSQQTMYNPSTINSLGY